MSELPRPRGPLSEAVTGALRSPAGAPLPAVRDPDPYGADLTVALHTCYELHYQGFDAVDPEWEWEPGLLAFRRSLERAFLAALRSAVGGGDDVEGVLDELLVEPVPGTGVSHFLRDEGEWWHLREYFVHRSIYHHKEADPHAWVIPRLRYFDDVPTPVIAVVNLMSMLGLHRALRGAMVGHFAAAEITTAPSAGRIAAAIRRNGGTAAHTHFFDEHIEADAVHEQILRHDVIGDLLAREPGLAADVVFGVQATELLEGRFGEHVLGAWRAGRNSLSLALPA
jgi:hypothetical protein